MEEGDGYKGSSFVEGFYIRRMVLYESEIALLELGAIMIFGQDGSPRFGPYREIKITCQRSEGKILYQLHPCW